LRQAEVPFTRRAVPVIGPWPPWFAPSHKDTLRNGISLFDLTVLSCILNKSQFKNIIKNGGVMSRISKVELIKLQKTLKTDERIAKKFKITRQAIQLMRKKYGIYSRLAKNPERNKKIRAMYKSGHTGTEIARKIGLSLSQTYRMIGQGTRRK
jgi:hypothetical protein